MAVTEFSGGSLRGKGDLMGDLIGPGDSDYGVDGVKMEQSPRRTPADDSRKKVA
jgi:hypothetical protein